VSALRSDSTYYYTVTPQGNTTTTSDLIKVHTNLTNAVSEFLKLNFDYKIIPGDGIEISGIPENCTLTISDLLGQRLNIKNTSSVVRFKLYQRGLYLLHIQKNQEFKTYKIVF
jgi:hypothetical protein